MNLTSRFFKPEAAVCDRNQPSATGLGAGEDADAVDQELAELEAEIALEGLSLDSAKKSKPETDAQAPLNIADAEASASASVVQSSSMRDWQAASPDVSGSTELSSAEAAHAAPTSGEDMQRERTLG